MNSVYFSFVVDALELHYFQAELLLYSLEQNSGVAKDKIIVQCIEGVSPSFFNFLEKNNYAYNVIKPYLDGKYCNKLQQLNFFVNNNSEECEGVVLMDTDMVVTSTLEKLCGDCFLAKTVDAPNPPIEILEKIYNAASISVPNIVQSDWDVEKNETYSGNFNGGLYYIPQRYLEIVNNEWKYWAEFLYAREELFSKKAYFIHVDQIAMSLVINSNNIEYETLDANYNCPVHFESPLSSLDETQPIKIIHYHRELNRFGFLKENKIKNHHILNSLQSFNKLLTKKEKLYFLDLFIAQKLCNYTVRNHELDKFEKKIKQLSEKIGAKKRIVLHFGTPKTGTTSLQFFLDQNHKALLEKSYCYPAVYLNTYAPKHQWLVDVLLHCKYEKFYEYLESIFLSNEMENCTNLILSTEGLYNHWWDYSAEAKTLLQILSEYFIVEPVVFFRSQSSLLVSLYKQYLKNPHISNIQCYGQSWSLQDMMSDEWFLYHFDYLSFIIDLEKVFKNSNIHLLKYSSNIIEDFCKSLKLTLNSYDIERENNSLSNFSIEMLKKINQLNLSFNDKEDVVRLIQKMDKKITKYDISQVDYSAEKEKISSLCSLQNILLKRQYSLDFSDDNTLIL